MQVLLIIEALEALISLATNAGLNIAKYNALKEANGGEPLTGEQRQELLADSQSEIDRLPD